MAQWAVVIPGERLAVERLYHRDAIELNGQEGPAPGDDVLLVAAGSEPAAVVATGRVEQAAPLRIAYLRRCFDDPVEAGDLTVDTAVTRLDAATYRALADRLAPPARVTTWLVSVDLPIEAESPAEAVRRFWSYVTELGPRELPAFVSPSDDELAMQAYVLGEPANLDPEEEDDQVQGE
jgi:hypothetical protein